MGNEPSGGGSVQQGDAVGGRGVYIGTYCGIRFYLDPSWFLIAALLTWVLATGYFPGRLPELDGGARFGVALMTAMLFFLSILLHELGHSVVSQRCGIPVPRITLLFIGGVAEIAREPEDAKMELKIALGGPVVSLLLGIFFLGVARLAGGMDWIMVEAVTWWLGVVNLTLLIFNLFPGYPLDGGRVLRALIWWKTGNVRKATYWASRMGIGFSWFLIVVGVLQLLAGNLFQGLLFIFIGMFLKSAAESGYQHTLTKDLLADVRVRELMTERVIAIPSGLPLNLVVDDYFLRHHHTAFPVVEEGERFVGVLRLEHLRSVEKVKWPYRSAGSLAAEVGTVDRRVGPEASASEVFRMMMTPGWGRLAVVTEEGGIIGFLTRHDVMRYMQVRVALSTGGMQVGGGVGGGLMRGG